MKRPNPLPPDKMTAAERRAELCGLLALGIVRLQLCAIGPNSLKRKEKFAYTLQPTDAVMQPRLDGEKHDDA